MDAYRERLNKLIEEHPKWDMKSLSAALDKSPAYLQKHIKSGVPRKLDGDDRRKLAMLLAVSESQLLPESEEADDVKAIAAWEQREDFTKIPVYDVTCSAGSGAVVEVENVLYHTSFSTDWLRSITHAPIHKLAVIRVQGDSMQPTLSNDDTVLVDMSQRQVRCDGVFVVVYQDMCLVKRVRVDPVRKTATIISDNPLYSPVEDVNPEDIRVAGKVIWIGKRV